MNVPGAIIGLVVTDNDARLVRETIQQNNELVASLDAEIAKAQAALQELLKQRTEAHRLLSSSAGPSETEAMSIRNVILTKEAHVARLQGKIANAEGELEILIQRRERDPGNGEDAGSVDSEIAHTRAILNGLAAEHAEQFAALETHRALLSPIRSLPAEILSEIFTHCLPRNTFLQPSVRKSPLLISRVSRTWRSIALSTPVLWASLTIKVSVDSCVPGLPIVATWLSRTGSCLLSFSITETIQKDYYEEGMITSARVLDLYAPHYRRWQNVQLEYQDWRIDTGLSRLPRDAPPDVLERLHLVRDFWRTNEFVNERTEEETQLMLLLSAPRLRECTWTSNTDLSVYCPPLAQLTKLFLERPISSEEFLRILRDGVNIEEAQFFVLTSPNTDADPPVLRHNLMVLELTADLCGRLFHRLELPRLQRLSIRGIGIIAAPVWPHEEFISILARSKCSIHALSLADMDMTPAQMAECLQQVSHSLGSLTLTNERRMAHTIIDERVLSLLTWKCDAAGQNICPNLTFLKMWDCVQAPDGALADMIESRWRKHDSNGPQKSLTIAFLMVERSSHPHDMHRLQALNDERMGISLLFRN